MRSADPEPAGFACVALVGDSTFDLAPAILANSTIAVRPESRFRPGEASRPGARTVTTSTSVVLSEPPSASVEFTLWVHARQRALRVGAASWQRVWDLRRDTQAGLELLVVNDDDATAQLGVLASALRVERAQDIELNPYPGWRGYGRPVAL